MSKSIDVEKLLSGQEISKTKQGFGTLEYLSLMPILLEQNHELLQRVKHLEETLIPEYDLTKRGDIKKYLDISESTLNNMMNDGRFKEGIHFKRELNGEKTKISFIESAILDFKEKDK